MKSTLGLLILMSLVACTTMEQNNQEISSSPVEMAEVSTDNIDQSIVLAQRRALDRLQAKQQIVVESQVEEELATEKGLRDFEHKYLMDTKNHMPKVQKWVRYYSVKDRERFQRFLNRGAQYKQVIQDLLVTNGLPPDLYYLGILESGYVTKALSHAGAVGPWQFMAPTGREYGLKINNYVDERQDPIRSTIAAVKYLKELFRQKKSWYMALAAYNAGPGRVKRAMRRGGSRNYWKLTRRRLLPYDTREYIPQFLAILTIGKDLEKYGFVERANKVFQPRELVKVPSAVKLKKVSEVSGLDLKTLKSFNAHLLKDVVPPTNSKIYHLWIPKNEVKKVSSTFNQLKTHRIAGLKVYRPRSYMRRTRIHRVRRGQNLTSIARRYGTSIRKIKKLNRLRSNRIYVGQKLRVKGRKKLLVRTAKRRPTTHRVKRGENLSRISKKYNVSVSRLKKINGLKRSKIFVGQRLKLTAGKRSIAKAKSKKTRRYKIRRGDNLAKIARRFGTTISRLKKLNNLKSSKILRGQTLVVASK